MKTTFREKIQYWFDNLMGKGAVALVGILFLATLIVIVGVGLVMALTGNGSVHGNIWTSLMHIIDAGTITAADTGDVFFVILMSVVTLCGIFVTSILIGIITTGFEEKLTNLKKGNSKVIEENHVVILGFDNSIFTIISELVIANENQKDGCIVILSEQEKEVVEEAIANEIDDLKNTRIICRTGSSTDTHMLKKCSLENCRSIIVNDKRDFMTIKTVIALNRYLNSVDKYSKKPHIVVTINDAINYEALKIISQGNVEVVLIEDAISRIIAQSCRQPGLSNVLVELFDYDGDELYFENFPQFDGIPFEDVLNQFEKAIVFGFKRNEEIFINPLRNTKMQKDDTLILLVEDDGVAKPIEYKEKNIDDLKSNTPVVDEPGHILIIGVNPMLAKIVLELDNYFCRGSKIIVANEEIEEELYELSGKTKNVEVSFEVCDTNDRRNLENLTSNNIDHVLLLSEYEDDDETTDSMTLFKLIHLRDIAQKFGRNYNITSEMKDVANQKLAEVTEVNDLVVGSNIINLILTQISENRDLSTVFNVLLSDKGSEIYIRKASQYLKLNVPIDFYEVTSILKDYDDIAIGYKKQVGNSYEIVVNPDKSDKIIFTENDYIISLSED